MTSQKITESISTEVKSDIGIYVNAKTLIVTALLLVISVGFFAYAAASYGLFGKDIGIFKSIVKPTFSLQVSAPTPRIDNKDFGFHSVTIEGTNPIGNLGEPSLPVMTKRILLPQGHDVDSVSISKKSKQVFKNVNIEPVQQPIPLSYLPAINEIVSTTHSDELIFYDEFVPSPDIELVKKKFGGEVPKYLLDDEGNLKTELFVRTAPDPEIYESSKPFPVKDYEIASIQEFRGYSILILNIFPVKYFPKDRIVEYYPDISFEVKTKEVAGYEVPASFRKLPVDEEEVKVRVDNYDKLNTYKKGKSIDEPAYEKLITESGSDESSQTAQSDFNYVIITSEEFVSDFQPLADWKASRPNNPISSTVVTVESILSNPDYECNSAYMRSLNFYFGDDYCHVAGHDDNASRIRNFIRDVWANSTTEYVLLGGDGDGGDVGGESGDMIIPARLFYDFGLSDSAGIPSDIYYGTVYSNFDYDGDGKFAEPGDGIGGGELPMMGDVYIGRAPVDSSAEVQTFVSKTIAYEQSDADYLKKALTVGEHLGFGTVAEYATETMEQIKWGGYHDGYNTNGLYEDYLIDPIYDSEVYSWSNTELIEIMNQGVNFINHLGHSSTLYNMKLCHAPFNSPGSYCGDSGDTDLDQLTNTDYFLVYSQGCYPASFDNWNYEGDYTESDSIAEHFVLDDNGAFAFVGNSRFGWGRFDSTDGPSQRFHRQFVDTMIVDGITNIAKANYQSKFKNFGNLSDPYIRFVAYELNVIGDPETPIKMPTFDEPLAGIMIPTYYDEVTDSINISGVAKKGTSETATFDHYTLSWGVGEPEEVTQWYTEGITLENSGTLEVDRGTLGSLDTLVAPDNTISLKLEVFNGSGLSSVQTIPIFVSNVKINEPLNYDIYRIGDELVIKGDLKGHHIINSVLEWRISDGDWSNVGLTLDDTDESIIGYWDTSVIGSKGLYELRLMVNYDIYSDSEETVVLYFDNFKMGWPVRIDHELADCKAWAGDLDGNVGDFNGDGKNEIVFYAGDCPPQLHIYNASGNEIGLIDVGVSGDKLLGGNMHKPVVGDIDNDSKDEIVVHFQNWGFSPSPSQIHAYNLDGSEVPGWPVDFESEITGLAMADLDLDGQLEVIIHDQQGEDNIIKILNNDASPVSTCTLTDTFTYQYWFVEYGTPAVGNFDEDQELEIVIISLREVGYQRSAGRINVLNSDCSYVNGWPVDIDGNIFNSPAVGDIDNDGNADIIFGTMDDLGVYALDKNGQDLTGWPALQGGGNFFSSPALTDFEGDGTLEVVISNDNIETFVIEHDGSIAKDWPQNPSWVDVYGSVTADIDNDGEPEIITTDYSSIYDGGGVFAWNFDGTLLADFPKLTESYSLAPAMIVDLDGDNLLELVATSNRDKDFINDRSKQRGSIYVWDLGVPEIPSINDWPLFSHDNRHTGNFKMQCSDKTYINECSSKKPLFCEDNELINDCQVCGCSSNKRCQENGTCVSKDLYIPREEISE
ncbi:C25 family cysteine peptidase [Patescibacteria group bacterium]